MVIKTKIGAHVSIAGGIDLAPARANGEGCETFQCFTPPQGGKAPELTSGIVNNFKAEMEKFGMETFYIHAPYYINFASLEPRIRHGSISVMRQELERGSLLDAQYVMVHVGSYTGQTLKAGIERVVEAIEEILDGYDGTTEFLMEIAAGSGNVIGDTFEEVGEIVRQVKNIKGFGGVCFDTCHAFASGYDYRTPRQAREMIEEFDKKTGLEFLKLTHVNDSKVDLNQKKDRHEHIGRGFIGQDGLAALLQTPEFLQIDWLLETEFDGRKEDVKKLKEMRENT